MLPAGTLRESIDGVAREKAAVESTAAAREVSDGTGIQAEVHLRIAKRC